MSAITVDDSRFPLVLVVFEGTASDTEFRAYLASMETQVLSRRQRNCTVLDATHSGDTSAVQRRMQADWLRRNAGELRRYSMGTAFVITSPLVRGLLTAVLWMSPMPTAHTVVATRSEAEAWALSRLAAGRDADASR